MTKPHSIAPLSGSWRPFPLRVNKKLGQNGNAIAQVPEASRSGAPHPLISELNPVWYS